MNCKKFFVAVVTAFVLCAASAASWAGTFWFPIDGHYPYSSNLIVTAVPDLDPTDGAMKTRLYQTGRKANGCIDASPSYPCSSSYVEGYSIWAYKKDGGGDWDFDGVLYDDAYSSSGHQWLWYDDHTGYDFISTNNGATLGIHAVDDGVTCGYSSDWGQICIEHSLPTGTYRTWYTHMTNIPSTLKTNNGNGHTVYRWDYLGNMGSKAPSGVSVNKHLHFVTKKLISGNWVVVDPYGHKPSWPGSTTDDPNNPYLWD